MRPIHRFCVPCAVSTYLWPNVSLFRVCVCIHIAHCTLNGTRNDRTVCYTGAMLLPFSDRQLETYFQ